jgi:thymidylate synthase
MQAYHDLLRRILDEGGPLPRLVLRPGVRSLAGFRYEDIAFEGYDPAPAIKAPVAV